MGLKINQLMDEQIKNKLLYSLISIFFLIKISCAQSSKCDNIKILNDLSANEYKSGDTLQIAFKNLSSKQFEYSLEVLMSINNEWYYSDYYTRYFNHQISYDKLQSILSSKLPYVAPKNYTIPTYDLDSNKTAYVSFIVDDNHTYKKLIRFRLHIFNNDENCSLILFQPFSFFKIK